MGFGPGAQAEVCRAMLCQAMGSEMKSRREGKEGSRASCHIIPTPILCFSTSPSRLPQPQHAHFSWANT
ncbi:hypothetical protein KOW79_014585 [Hemibagrus wyckioides]|uniref:Uncharacterized protein n=1 Tax=Hemibagrus wyckioides TaxID=337641 RepID=A0A9D3SEY7_9TELE|nr:hypothetical protein KOW79_014585 [Hemibagrus wyckioides]